MDAPPGVEQCLRELWQMNRAQNRKLNRMVGYMEGDPAKGDGVLPRLREVERRQEEDEKRRKRAERLAWIAITGAVTAVGSKAWAWLTGGH